MNNLRELRKRKKISMKKLGLILGAAESTVSHWENGMRQPDSETLIKLADYFGVTVDYLLGRTNTPTVQWSENDIVQGVGSHPIVLSDEDSYRLNVLARAEEVLGKEFVDAHIKLLELATENALKK